MPKSSHTLSVYGLAMLNIAAVLSLRGLPMMAETGLHMLFYLSFASLLFLVPCSLVTAELATGWSKEGGVYVWIKEAFGSRWGFVAIWLQWIQNVIWFPVILAFAASAFAYLLLQPDLANNNIYSGVFIITVYWLATAVTFTGLKSVENVTSYAVMFGTIIPVILIIIMSIVWMILGEPIGLLQSELSWLPDFSKLDNVVFLAGIILLFAGMEVGAVHVCDLKKPNRQYPKALFIAVFIIVTVFSLGSFAIAVVLPNHEISLTAGVLQSFDKMLSTYNLHWLLPVIGLLVAFGAIGGVMAWISGPSKGLLATALEGEIPPYLAHTNKKCIPSHILIIQGLMVTLLACLYFVMESVNVVFFLLSAMTISLYLVVYMLIFLSALWLRYSQPHVHRAFEVPGGKLGMWVVSVIGLMGVFFAFITSFFPPTELHIATPKLYVCVVSGGFVLFFVAPFIMQVFKKPQWKRE